MKKRIAAVVLSAVMVFSTVSSTTAFAVENNEALDNGSVYYSDFSNYTANKLTHADKGTKTADGIVDYAGNGVVTDEITGVGDRVQSYSWSAQAYGDWVYVGTCASAMMTTLNFMKSTLGNNFDDKTMTATLNAMFNGNFCVGEEDGGNTKGILVKFNTKTGEVKLVMSEEKTGTKCQFRNSVKYKDKFYFCGAVNSLPCVYEIDPKTDEYKLVYQSINAKDYYEAYLKGICVGIRGICEYKGKLIISLVGLNGPYICASENPSDINSFEVIADMDDMFGYTAYHLSDSIYGGSIWDMIEFNGSLYVSLCTGTKDNMPDDNTMQSFAIIRGDIDENNNWSWTPVAGDVEKDNAKYTFGIDPERTRAGAANLCVYGDYLYIGEYNDEEIALENVMFDMNCDFVNANLEQSVNLYRMDSEENIELVVGDATEMFPDGSITGIGAGFGRNENQYIWRMQVYNNKLYIGTFDTSSLLEPIGQFTNGDLIKMTVEEWNSQIDYINVLIDLLINQKVSLVAIDKNDVDSKLSSAQADEIVELVNDSETIDCNTATDLSEVKELSAELTKALNEHMDNSFVEVYTKIYDIITKISSNVSPNIALKLKDIFTKENINNMKSFLVCAGYLSKAERGFDLYTLDEDMNVETITVDGFGDPYNHGCRVFAVTNDELIVGTANPFYGTQLWSVENYIDDSIYDVNCDGIVSIDDVTYIQKVLADIIDKPEDFDLLADVNGDGKATIDDATEIQYYLTDMI